MRDFAEIYDMAAGHHGGAKTLEEILASQPYGPPLSDNPAKLPDDRWLSAFTRFVFSAGFNWKVIANKWDGFEEAFHGFDTGYCAMMSDDDIDALLKDKRIVRNGSKILSVRDNAVFLREIAREHGKPAGQVFATWPMAEYMALLDLLKKRGSRLGGTTAQYALRFIGMPSLILSKDVVAALVREGVVDREPSGKAARAKVQEAVNIWMKQSGRSLTEISKVLALSVGS
ncbi:MAG: DNA-3-methyladenine glycosylase I [Rhodobiaceae bacterium]|nr:DNA-3-methyladenine glycosylase I [Rhodobiaceae bacterium]MCC0050656.1 DNA-3-methyladenine glycosylase I [Rhodobiaceae bacterium]MCC0059859.1 DNA-3-methyladenine glycosylase I [Rhodobiaceae bacterium]